MGGIAIRCLTWGRQPGNDKVLEFFGTTFETYARAADTLMGRLRSVLPEGSTRCRIRASAREGREPQQGTLLDTLGDETVGYVMIDPSCNGAQLCVCVARCAKPVASGALRCCSVLTQGISPMRYSEMDILNGIIGKSSVRLCVEDALLNKSWRKVGKRIEGLDDKWCEDFSRGVQLLKQTWVKATEPHYDAKVFPHSHPYGTGSLLSELGSGGQNGIPRMCRSRPWRRKHATEIPRNSAEVVLLWLATSNSRGTPEYPWDWRSPAVPAPLLCDFGGCRRKRFLEIALKWCC